MIDINDLRLLLKLNGIDDTQYTDEDLEKLIDYYTKVFDSLICFNYHSKQYEDFIPADDSFNSLLLNHFPVTNLITLTIKEKNHLDDIRNINLTSGIIHFKKPFIGDTRVIYRSGWSDEDIERLINPIILDLIIWGIKYGKAGLINSITEGDVSVSYDNTDNILNINQRIRDLNKRFCPKARML